MTQEEIIRMAREAGFYTENWSFGERASVYESGKTIDITNELKDFAALVASHEKKFWMEQIEVECNEAILSEREACARVCEGNRWGNLGIGCAAAIRARGAK